MTLQSIKHSGLMASMVTISLTLISRLNGKTMYLQIQFAGCWSRANLSVDTPALAQLLHMLRARGKPHRGMAWYAYDSRRKRQKAFERALALASARATRETREHGRHNSPPMAYVEEMAPDESFQNCPEHLIFTILDNWNPPTSFGNEIKLSDPGTSHRRKAEEQAEYFTTCYVQEEVSSEGEEMASPTRGPPPEIAAQQYNQPAGRLSKAIADTEGTHVQGPNPFSTIQEDWEDQPPYHDTSYLELLFETRSMVDDQIFRAIQIGHRLDMMYAAHSRASPRLQCPTCSASLRDSSGMAKER
jgi:hypothetical protein